MRLSRTLSITVALLLLATAAAADVVVLKSGKKIRGGYAEVGDEVIVNPFNSRHPKMVFEIQRIPRASVKELIREDRPRVEFQDRRLALAPDDIEGRLELAAWCKGKKLEAERILVLLEILKIDPEQKDALKGIGSAKFRKLAKGDPEFDEAARAAVASYLEIADPAERKKAYGRMKREQAIKLPQEYFDRMIRSAGRKKGRIEDVPLTLGSKESPGVYTIYVPKAYDSRRAWPLVIGLHGGGRGGKDGKEVVGSGPSAMNFYSRQAAKRGYIVVCPTALEAPWRASPNHAFIRSLIDETKLLYNLDTNRIYMTGHSMGGFGTWHLGPMFAEELAAISPMAGGGGPSSKLDATSTPVFVFHGSDDNVVGPGSDRNAAKAMVGGKLEFIYTELSGVGHGFPGSIQNDLFDFFDRRRLATGRGRKLPDARVVSSFLVKVSRDEKRYLGDPLEFGEAGSGGRGEWKQRLKELKLGGGSAEGAATRLGELKDEDSVKPLGDLIRHKLTAEDVKVHAARALGLIGHVDGYAGLVAGLKSESHELVKASAKAMAAIRAPKSGAALIAALGHTTKTLEGKRMGDRVHVSDWKPWLGALIQVVRSVGELKSEGGAAAIHRTAVRSIFGQKWAVLYSTRVPMNPWGPRVDLAKAVCEAVLTLGQPEGRAAVIAMKDSAPDPRDTKHGDVVRICEATLGRLPE